MKKIYFVSAWGFMVLLVFSCGNNSSSNTKNDKPLSISNTERSASSVYLTEDEDHIPIMTYVEVDSTDEIHFYFSKLDTVEGAFGTPVSIPIEQDAEIHEEGMPKMAVKGDGTLLALYETSVAVENSRWGLGDVRYIQSFDEGETWTESQSIDPKQYAKERSSGFANLARMPDGEIGIVWLGTDPDLNDGGRPVKFTKTVGKDSLAEVQTLEAKACECCRIGIAGNEDGKVGVAFRDILPGSIRDIAVSFSSDNGASFNKPVSFSEDNWELDGCPHNGPGVSFREDDFQIGWFTDGENHKGVNYAVLNDSGTVKTQKQLNPNGRYVQIGTNQQPIAAYDQRYKENDSSYSKIMVNRITNDERFELEVSLDKKKAKYPVVHGFNSNRTVVAWNEDGKILYRIIENSDITRPVEEIPELAAYR